MLSPGVSSSPSQPTASSRAPAVEDLHALGPHALATRDQNGGFVTAGAVDPAIAAGLLSAHDAILIDVRTVEELRQIGSVPGSIHVAWQLGAAMTRNPRFLKELSAKAGPDAVLLFICRSGKRSADAALAALKAGYVHSYNVLEGVEGTDGSTANGWRNRGLPWSPGQAR